MSRNKSIAGAPSKQTPPKAEPIEFPGRKVVCRLTPEQQAVLRPRHSRFVQISNRVAQLEQNLAQARADQMAERGAILGMCALIYPKLTPEGLYHVEGVLTEPAPVLELTSSPDPTSQESPQ